jgi:hypothetical protein
MATVTIRNLPDEVHTALVDLANQEGLSLNQFLVRELETVARRNEIDGWFAEIDELLPEPLPLDDLLDDLRQAREER